MGKAKINKYKKIKKQKNKKNQIFDEKIKYQKLKNPEKTPKPKF
jgi:hypothetical protein